MKKTTLVFIVMLVASISLYAKNEVLLPYPDYAKGFEEIKDVPKFLAEHTFDVPPPKDWGEKVRLFKQIVGPNVFYRFLLIDNRNVVNPDFANSGFTIPAYMQYLFLQKQELLTIIGISLFNISLDQFQNRVHFADFFISYRNGNLALWFVEMIYSSQNIPGLPRSSALTIEEYNRKCIGDYIHLGFVSEYAYLYKDIDKLQEQNRIQITDDNFERLPKYRYLEVGSLATPLIDNSNPFRYTIQNAFDGDPSTSYATTFQSGDRSDSDMYINTNQEYYAPQQTYSDSSKTSATNFATLYIINGYAKNYDLYKKNKRIKSLAINWTQKIELEDNSMSFQVFPLNQEALKKNEIEITSTSTYPGDKWTDTCIAEIDIQLNDGSFLFGGVQ